MTETNSTWKGIDPTLITSDRFEELTNLVKDRDQYLTAGKIEYALGSETVENRLEFVIKKLREQRGLPFEIPIIEQYSVGDTIYKFLHLTVSYTDFTVQEEEAAGKTTAVTNYIQVIGSGAQVTIRLYVQKTPPEGASNETVEQWNRASKLLKDKWKGIVRIALKTPPSKKPIVTSRKST